ncbi:hypothetical protein H0I76_10430 [Limibaculum sp. M0105]|uniref:Fenitrothion hydrolase n=1 Tax=Thermohalobaculum xanthum TaxID=2753746 RepID=A0A8J7M8K2_9RHOB|nr:hypothetical protein [Thermohalobaculum xanthum]MBK0399609.1 hypothetical protein [Thermohalobaculum xanthum]
MASQGKHGVRFGGGLAACALGLLSPVPALAHVAQRAIVLLLPTGHSIWGGTLAVAATFGLLALVPGQWLARAFAWRVPLPQGGEGLRVWTGWLGFVTMAGLIAAGIWGSRDPLENPLPLAVWTVFWVAFVILHAFLGNLWAWVNPWQAPLAALRRLGIGRRAAAQLPRRLGLWPATLGLAAIYWFTLVDIAPDDPARLARAVTGWWALHLIAMLVFGEAQWRARGETLSVLTGFLARLAPVGRDASGRRVLSLPGARATEGAALPGTTAFLLLALAGGSFDGLNETFWWLARIGINPLDFPGRSAVVAEHSLGLAGAWVGLMALYGGALALGARLAGGVSVRDAAGPLALSLVPIALAYHLAHYLIVLLINGQYVLVALSDPFGTGADWLGLGHHFVTTSFLNRIETVSVIWTAQAAIIVGGHVWAVILADAIATRIWAGGRGTAVLSQVPLAALMVLYTLFGLWLLSTPVGA